MMDFMDSLKRGVDRAGFEVDRLLRANRVRARINSLRSQVDEEERQIGRRVLELCRLGQLQHQELLVHCERVTQYQQEIQEREVELEAINQEAPPPIPQMEAQPSRPEPITCPNCGATAPEDAVFCPRCGVNLKAAFQTPPPPPPAAE